MKILATATLAALIGSAALIIPASAKTVLPMADRDACLGNFKPLPSVSPEQLADLKSRSSRPNESGIGMAQLAQRRYAIALERFYIAQCKLRSQGAAYERRCPLDLISMQSAIDELPAAAFSGTKAELQRLLSLAGDELTTLRAETRRACKQ